MKKTFSRAMLLSLCLILILGVLTPALASGTLQSKSADGNIVIDYTNAAAGYVSVSAKVSGDPKLCVMVAAPTGVTYKYFYTDSKGVAQRFVLSEGDGNYKIGVYKNTSGNKYSCLHSYTVQVKLNSGIAPFKGPNLYVDYTDTTKCVEKAKSLCSGCNTELEKVAAVYYYVINNFTYDYDKAKTVQSGYRPVLDTVWDAKKGICFDYSSTMCAMLRSQGVAAKLVVGYAETVYHAWINVYTEESGWVEAVIFFDGNAWKLMDPTYASTSKSSAKIMEYINDTSHYSAKYVY